jgi:TRAP-type C4-dicarboxylate transport system permease small subunit
LPGAGTPLACPWQYQLVTKHRLLEVRSLLLYFKSISQKININKNIVNNLNSYTEKIAVVVLFSLMLLTTADVFLRTFYRPISGVIEITQLGLAVIVFTALGYSQVTREHIQIDFFMNLLPLKLQRFIQVIVYLLVLGLYGVVFWQLLVYGERLKALNSITPVLKLPIYPVVYVAAIGVLFFLLVLFADLVESSIKMAKGEDTDVV